MVFARRSDSVKAFRRYNNVQLDGRPMKIEIVGINAQLPVSARVNVGGPNGRRRTVVMGYAFQFPSVCFDSVMPILTLILVELF